MWVILTGPAAADLKPVGHAVPTGSWTQEFILTGAPVTDTFDKVLIGLVVPASQRPWEVQNVSRSPGGDLDVLSNGGSEWSSVADIRGLDMSSLSFTLHLAGDMDDGVSFVLSAYDRYGCWRYSYDGIALAASPHGVTWCIRDCGIDLQTALVPVPGTALLGFLGLGYAGTRLRKPV
jgi:hypothetical protein